MLKAGVGLPFFSLGRPMHFPMDWVNSNDFGYKNVFSLLSVHKAKHNVDNIQGSILLIVQINFTSWNFITPLPFSLLTVTNNDKRKAERWVLPLKTEPGPFSWVW